MQELVHSAWSMIPFGLMLLTIAVAPLLADHWWESNKHKLEVALFLGIPTAVCLIMGGMLHELEHQLFGDYIPFIVLLLALYVITGGIHLSGDIKAKPWVNTLFLGIAWLLASIMGTTGAAMLLIRPLLTTNQQREYKVHTVLFFIALAANCGGLLTPLGDPPLFMLFLRGASFTWFLSLLPQWLFTGVILLALYFALDTYYYKKEHWTALSADHREHVPMRLGGKLNFLYLIGVVLSVAFINSGTIPEMAAKDAPMWLKYMREIALLSLTGLSLYTTKHKVRYELNKFTWAPIVEVAVLFLGIFTTMTPALAYLNANAASLGLDTTWQFYYTTGLLSSFLDNTPTAVAFHSVATGLTAEQMAAFSGNMEAGIPEVLLMAIAIASVFFGAMTYIGNGPNFMVKAIAEENGIKMPSFFGYMLKFSLVVLLPVYILVQLIFL
ncbi:MAG: sodium:proton antiporter [Paludibacteraceae bacterium]|jgi:Na+/H+ antiporter NhaD/arsenite permease-like protein|nr:sodium:proton antiporter [Paludibacteraceae bacterium]